MTVPRDDDHLSALLALSVETALIMKEAAMEAAKERHPSSLPPVAVADTGTVLTAVDRCDGCGAGAVSRMRDGKGNRVLDFCGHHWTRHAPKLTNEGWKVDGTNPDLLDAMYGYNRAQGESH
jgi:hypothetical protein